MTRAVHPSEPGAPTGAPRPAGGSGFGRIVGNLSRLAGGKAVAGLISLVYLVMVTRHLGATGYGVLVLIHGYVVLVGGIVAFSGFHGVIRYGAQSLARGDAAGFARIVRFMGVVELACGVLALAVAALLLPWVGPRIGLPPALMPLALVYSLAVTATVRATPQGLLQLADRFDLLALHQLVAPVVRLVGAAGVLLLDGGLAALVLVWLAAAVAEGAAMWLLGSIAWRALAGGERWRGAWRRPGAGADGLVRFSLLTNLDITLRELAPNLAPVTIGWLLGPAATGVFGLVQRATAILVQPAQLLGQASYSVYAGQVARGELARLRTAVARSCLLAGAAGGAIAAVLALRGDALLPLIGGRTFAVSTTLLALVALGRAATLAATPPGVALTALGHPQRPLLVGLAINLGLYPLLPLLLSGYGIEGAGLHAMIQGATGAALLFVLYRRSRRAAGA